MIHHAAKSLHASHQPPSASQTSSAQAFIAKWHGKDGSERANYRLFITELCELLEVPKPDPARRATLAGIAAEGATQTSTAGAQHDAPTDAPSGSHTELVDAIDNSAADAPEPPAAASAPTVLTRRPWPPELPEQMRATAEVLAASSIALSTDALAEHFTGRGPWKKRLPQILDTLEALGRACKAPGTGATRWTHA